MTNPGTRLSATVDQLPGLAGHTFGPSEWLAITQDDVNRYADISHDHNPIHVDPHAAAKSPFGTTIVHGYLTLSLVAPLLDEVLEVKGASMGVNYGLNRLRFPAPVPTGSRIRISGVIERVTQVPGGYQVEPTVTFEVEGGTKPVCVAEMLLRYYT